MSENKEKENKLKENYRLHKWCVGGDINQAQNCNVNVKQPNNNVICSNDTKTNQAISKADDDIREVISGESLLMDLENNVDSYGANIKQNANSTQKTEQPESNIYNADSSTINQSNKGRTK